MSATVKNSFAAVTWSNFFDEYSVTLKGEAQDPVPSGAASDLLGGVLGGIASALTPNLEWNVSLKICESGSATDPWFPGLDVSAATFGAIKSFGSGRLIKGSAQTRRYPSYIVYLTMSEGTRIVTNPIFFADANDRSLAGIVLSSAGATREVEFSLE